MKEYGKLLMVFISAFAFTHCSKQKSEPQNETVVEKESMVDVNLASNDKDYYLPTSTTHEVIKHKFYTLSYSEENEQAEWVAYELKKDQLSHSNLERPFFIDDPEVETGSASWKNYKRSGYDKGHLCPAGDRRFSREAFNETFYTSNISPQLNDFNAGIWNNLEQKTRYWAAKYDGVYVVTGGVLNGNLKTIGKEHVAVPKYFYKILLDNSRGEYKTIAFLVPHEDSERPLNQFVVSIDAIEKMTGIDFFSKLPDAIENKLEKTSDYKGWSF
ncbi:DNA/RNA non-specific endonuclease [Flavobacterium sp.]|uniref:DNA/RNA non-specific endonuclease n=1 Tax=Flavobacterium sp. TaxID=239 RepID=UPI00260D3AF3|nr:DNA/RNA non-specific endonuclease [Flavobacterium sp.]